MVERVRRLDWANFAKILAGVLVGLAVSWIVLVQRTQQAQIDGLSKGTTAACAQVTRLGYQCAAKPAASIRANPAEPTQPAAGATGPRGPGPTDEQVREAVVAYFVAHPVVNDTPPKASTVQRYVDAYLAAHPVPSGPAGSPGPTGATGAKGDTGNAGRGITSVSCTGTHLVVMYTDSTQQDLGDGSCGQGPQGEPGQPVTGYSYTQHGPLGDTSYECTWDGQSTAEPHYDCKQTN